MGMERRRGHENKGIDGRKELIARREGTRGRERRKWERSLGRETGNEWRGWRGEEGRHKVALKVAGSGKKIIQKLELHCKYIYMYM